MTLTPRFDSPDPSKRKLMYWVCDRTGKCFSTNPNNLDSLAASGTVKRRSRLDNEKSLSEIILGEKPYASE